MAADPPPGGTAPGPALRDPALQLQRLRAQWPACAERWIFGYASLIWRPEFVAAETRPALLHGWHRALRMRSRINRGTAQQPGLVFTLLQGGACKGFVYRMPVATTPSATEAELDRLWAREMPTGMYDARLVRCHTQQGPVQALAFTLSGRSEACLPRLPDAQLLQVLRHAKGRYGTTLDYLLQTAAALRAHGVHDREIERQVALAQRHGLC
jgi:glutathione-specific gamma-glutamylcyclotransferase